MENDLSEQHQIRLDKTAALRQKGCDPFDASFKPDCHASDVLDGYARYEGHTVSVAGRLMAKRAMGKASFAHVQDISGQLQIYIRQSDVGDDAYELFRSLDLGDIVGVTGRVFTTKTGEISIHTDAILLLSKSLRPLPEKWHGLKDVEIRYRYRHLDLIANPHVKDVFIARSQIIQELRRLLAEKDFLEVETPVLHNIAAGAAARPFVTHHNTLDIALYMRIATELHLKRLIVGGFERVFEVGRVFRNEGIDTRHNPEFTLLELYQAYADYRDMMDLTEELIRSVCMKIRGVGIIDYQGTKIDLESPWRRVSMSDLVKEHTGADYTAWDDDETARDSAARLGVHVDPNASADRVLYEIFDSIVVEKIIQPTFVIGYPLEISPLAKESKETPGLAARFELFIVGREHANAYSELNDPIEQRLRFLTQSRRMAGGDEEAQQVDEDYVYALEQGMPPTGGLGIGIDRVVMLITDSPSIRDVILYPTMRPLG